MKICSVTLAGSGAEAIIGDALRSVSWADAALLIWTGVTDEAFRRVFDAVHAANGASWAFSDIPWKDDFAVMRNAALDAAATHTSCEWAVWLDTDERLVVPDPNLLREELNAQPHTVSALRAWHVDGSYGKERFIRLPRQGEYVGPTHEYWRPHPRNSVSWMESCRFDELPREKDSPQWRDKLARDQRILEAYVVEHDEARWWYYLGDTYGFDDIEKAISCWERAVKTDGHAEIRGWAAFRAANAHIERGDPKRALQLAITGLMVWPHGAELLYIAGQACFALGRYHDAMAWAMHAGAAGSYKGWGREVNRTGFVWPPADWFMPYDLLASCYAKMKRKPLARLAKDECEKAKQAMSQHFGYAASAT